MRLVQSIKHTLQLNIKYIYLNLESTGVNRKSSTVPEWFCQCKVGAVVEALIERVVRYNRNLENR